MFHKRSHVSYQANTLSTKCGICCEDLRIKWSNLREVYGCAENDRCCLSMIEILCICYNLNLLHAKYTLLALSASQCQYLRCTDRDIKIEEKCQNKQEGRLRREGQADSFKACCRSAVGGADVFRSWPRYILLTEKTSAWGQPGINCTKGRNNYCGCTFSSHGATICYFQDLKFNLFHISLLWLDILSWAKWS